jgi:hypothetical protein
MTTAGVHTRPPITAWTVFPDAVPVALTALSNGWSGQDGSLLYTLSGSFGFGLRQVQDQWRACHAISDVAGYLIELRPVDRARAEDTTVDTPARGTAGYAPILVSSCRRDVSPAGRVVVHATFQVDCNEFASQVDRDTTAGRAVMADAIRALLQKSEASSPEAIAAIVEAWCASPPTFALEITQTFTTQNDLPRPIQLDPAHVSDTDRLIAEAIREAGVAPGDYVGAAAKALDRDTLAPTALRVLTQRLAQHSLHDLVLYAMHQLQCVVVHVERTLRDIQRAATHMSVTWDPEQRYEHLEQEQLTLWRCVETAVEAALRTAPAADLPVDVVTWSEILAAANAYLAAASRSEAIHHQVTPRAPAHQPSIRDRADQRRRRAPRCRAYAQREHH